MLNRRQMLAASAAAVTLPASATPASQANTLYATFLDETLAVAPELATSLGLDTGTKAALRSRLSDTSLKARDDDKARFAGMMTRMHKLDRAGLSGLDATNYDSILYDLEHRAAGRKFAFGNINLPYAVDQLDGTYLSLPDFLDSQHPVENKSDAEAYLARLNAMAKNIDGENECLRHDAGLGVVPPDFAIAATLKQLKAFRANPPASSVLVSSLVRRTKDKHIDGDYAGRASKIVAEKIYPALDRQIAAFEGMKGKTTHDAGVWRLPQGDAYYAVALEAGTTTKMSPQQIHKLGLDVVAQCQASCDAIMKANGLTKGSVGARLRQMFADKKFIYPNTDAAKEKLIADLNAKLGEVKKKLPAYFGILPKAGVTIKRVPKYTEASAPGGYYQNGTIDGKRPGAYYINLRNTAEVPSWALPTLTFHESIPGHHLQISIAQETNLPMIRRIEQYNAYVEGWALYAEQLAVEMGMYANDPWGHIGQLHDAMLRGVRLVIDTGLHAMRWSREKAVAYYADTLGDPDSGAITEVERYCVWPGQACGYMVGKIDILRLRDKAKAALGPRFDIRGFNDAVLSSGALPLGLLDQVIGNYIAGAKA